MGENNNNNKLVRIVFSSFEKLETNVLTTLSPEILFSGSQRLKPFRGGRGLFDLDPFSWASWWIWQDALERRHLSLGCDQWDSNIQIEETGDGRESSERGI